MDKEYLKKSVKKNENYQKKNKKDTYISETLLNVVQKFMKKYKRICYGGTAINSILPKDKQFYDYDIDIPDYDFFSPNALEDAKALCNLFKKENVFHIEGKNAVVYGTYKVFVNFVPIADVTQIDPHFYEYLLPYAIDVDGLLYTPPSYLRMSLHQELARPLGDVSRWEKIYDRMKLLNLYYPVLAKPLSSRTHLLIKQRTNELDKTYDDLFEYFRKTNHVFCNTHLIACVYKRYMKENKCLLKENKDIFFMYSDSLDDTLRDIRKWKPADLTVSKESSIYKFIDDYAFLKWKGKIIGVVFQTNSCLSYFQIKYKYRNIRVGNIDTLMNLYFSLLLMDKIPLQHGLIISILADLNRIVHKYPSYIKEDKEVPKVIQRFNLPCYGKQDDFQNILRNRQKKYKELKNNKQSIEYKKWFFKYIPTLPSEEKSTASTTFKKRPKKDKRKTKKTKKTT